MLPKQRSFLDDLGTLFRKYNIDYVGINDGLIEIVSNNQTLAFKQYGHSVISKFPREHFIDVTIKTDYLPEYPEEISEDYSGEEDFDD